MRCWLLPRDAGPLFIVVLPALVSSIKSCKCLCPGSRDKPNKWENGAEADLDHLKEKFCRATTGYST